MDFVGHGGDSAALVAIDAIALDDAISRLPMSFMPCEFSHPTSSNDLIIESESTRQGVDYMPHSSPGCRTEDGLYERPVVLRQSGVGSAGDLA
jgi:hypothetical protein